jgi:hypothetical protein
MSTIKPSPFRRRNVPPPAPQVDTSSLVPHLQAQDAIPEESREGSEIIHLSSITRDWCARRHAIHYRHRSAFNGIASPTSAQRLVWTIGRAVEHHIRVQLIKALTPESFLGEWTCACGAGTRRGFGQSQPKVCFKCSVPVMHYRELRMIMQNLPTSSEGFATPLVSASPDMILRMGFVLEVMEIKSKKLSEFEALTAPLGDHVMQASGYAHVLSTQLPPGYTVSDHVRVVYGAKDYPRPGVAVYKEYRVPVRAEAATLINQAGADITAVQQNNTSALPSRLSACTSNSSPRAKRCSACTLCFHLP